jgi:hypothetical protein
MVALDFGGMVRRVSRREPAFTGGRAKAAPSVYLAVAMAGVGASGVELEIAMADDAGDLRLTARTSGIDHVLARRISSLAHSRRVVLFQHRFQSGLLPPRSLDGACSVECAWRTFQEAARRRPGSPCARPLDLEACVALAGLPAPAGPGAEAQARAIRDLWVWSGGGC